MVLVLSVGATKLTANIRRAATARVIAIIRLDNYHCRILQQVGGCTCGRLYHLGARRPHRSSCRRLDERNCDLAEPPKPGPRRVDSTREEPPADPLQGF